MTVLSQRALNRATLERQLLLERSAVSAFDVIERLAGLQAQDPDPPYIGLWSRLRSFTPADLISLLESRKVVRATLYRGTQHLVSSSDYLWLQPLLQPVQLRVQKGGFGKATAGLDLSALAKAARDFIGDGTVSRPELGQELVRQFPGRDPVALARTVQYLLPIIHPPPDGTWRRHGPTPFTMAPSWLGRSLATSPSPPTLILRYLAAFGPATVADVQAWSGLTRLREVVDGMRSSLVAFGNDLYDVPDGPRPDPDTPAPVRFFAPLDNVVLSYADRSRLMTDSQRKHVGVEAVVTVDGFVRGLWTLKRDVLSVRLFSRLSKADKASVLAEAFSLLAFAEAGHDNVQLSSLE